MTVDRISQLEKMVQDLAKQLADRDTELKNSRQEVRRHQNTGKTVEGIVRSTTHLLVPESIVRGNHAEYMKYKRMADEDGLEFQITSEASVKDLKPMPERYESDRAVYIAKPVLNGDGAKYREEKAVAERAGKRLIICNTSSEFPLEAFKEAE